MGQIEQKNSGAGEQARAKLRLRLPERKQMTFQQAALDQMIEEDHQARWVWECVCQWDLSCLTRQIAAVEGTTGRDHTDPRILLALWILATLDGYGSARELERLCRYHLAYRWICGGVSVNHNLLSMFRRTANLEELLVQMIASLLQADLVTMQTVALDGMKVRASASKDSLHRQPKLAELLAQVRTQLQRLSEETRSDNEGEQRRQERKRQHLEARQARLAEAIKQVEQQQEHQQQTAKRKGKKQRSEPRCSTTDPDCRKMKFTHGGYLPAYNVQFATDVASGMVVGVEVTNKVSDGGLLEPLVERVHQQYQRRPDQMLVDGGYVNVDQIDRLEVAGVEVYAPVPQPKKSSKRDGSSPVRDPYEREKRDSDAVFGWRSRMKTESAKEIYGQRASVAERTNAHARNRVLSQFLTRGKQCCQNVALLCALAQNVQAHRHQLSPA